MDDVVGCDNQDEEAVAMVEESPSGIFLVFKAFNLAVAFYLANDMCFCVHCVPSRELLNAPALEFLHDTSLSYCLKQLQQE